MFWSDQQQVDGSGQVEKVEQIAEFKERTNTLLNQILGQSVSAIRIIGWTDVQWWAGSKLTSQRTQSTKVDDAGNSQIGCKN